MPNLHFYLASSLHSKPGKRRRDLLFLVSLEVVNITHVLTGVVDTVNSLELRGDIVEMVQEAELCKSTHADL